MTDSLGGTGVPSSGNIKILPPSLARITAACLLPLFKVLNAIRSFNESGFYIPVYFILIKQFKLSYKDFFINQKLQGIYKKFTFSQIDISTEILMIINIVYG